MFHKSKIVFHRVLIGGSLIFYPGILAYAALFDDNLSRAPGADVTIQRVLAILAYLACWLSRLSLTVVVGGLVVYAILFFKSQGNPQAFGEAKKAFTWGLVGILVIFAVYTIIKTIASFVGVDYPITPFTSC